MPNTKSRSLLTMLPIGATAVRVRHGIATKKMEREVSLTTTSAQATCLFHGYGKCRIERIVFLPDIAVASNITDKWTIDFVNKGTGGAGATSIGTYSTYASDTTTLKGALTAFDAAVVYSNDPGLEVDNDTVITFLATEGGTAANLVGKMVVEYVALLED